MINIKEGVAKIFPEKFKQEGVVYICRRHKVLLILDEFKVLIALAALIALPIILDKYEITLFDEYRALLTALYIVALAFLATAFYARYYNWKYDLYIITDQRVIDSNRYFPFRKIFTEADLEKVQDSTYNVPGALGFFFHFGNVKIETAGEASNFEWSGIPSPRSAQQILRRAIETVRGNAGDEI